MSEVGRRLHVDNVIMLPILHQMEKDDLIWLVKKSMASSGVAQYVVLLKMGKVFNFLSTGDNWVYVHLNYLMDNKKKVRTAVLKPFKGEPDESVTIKVLRRAARTSIRKIKYQIS